MSSMIVIFSNNSCFNKETVAKNFLKLFKIKSFNYKFTSLQTD